MQHQGNMINVYQHSALISWLAEIIFFNLFNLWNIIHCEKEMVEVKSLLSRAGVAGYCRRLVIPMHCSGLHWCDGEVLANGRAGCCYWYLYPTTHGGQWRWHSRKGLISTGRELAVHTHTLVARRGRSGYTGGQECHTTFIWLSDCMHNVAR